MTGLTTTPRLTPERTGREACRQPACSGRAGSRADHAVTVYFTDRPKIEILACQACADAIERAQENGTLALPPDLIGRDSHVEVLYLEA